MTIANSTVKIRAGRILSRLSHYRRYDAGEAPAALVQLLSKAEGQCLGYYSNDSNRAEDLVAVTEVGLCWQGRGEPAFVRYTDIEAAKVHLTKADDLVSADGLSFVLSSGGNAFVTILGGTDKFKDAFEFLRFVDRVREDIRGI